MLEILYHREKLTNYAPFAIIRAMQIKLSSRFRRSIEKIIHLLPVLAAPFVLLSPVWAAGRALFWGTSGLQFTPWWHLAWESLRAGEFPVWNLLAGMGSPLLANYQSALLYPPVWGLLLLDAVGGLPALAWGQALYLALHLGWAGVGMVLVARQAGMGRLAQAVSGLAFGLSGWLAARGQFLSMEAATAWLPWVLLAVMKLRWERGAIIRLGVVVAMQLLAGHAQTAWYSLSLAGVWVVWNGARNAYSQFSHPLIDNGTLHFGRSARPDRFLLPDSDASLPESLRQSNILSGKENLSNLSKIHDDLPAQIPARHLFAALGKLWLAFTLAIGLAVIFAAGQLLPTAEYLLESPRASQVDYDQAMTYSFWPWRLIGLAAPDFFGNPAHGDYWGYAAFWEDAVYIGLLPLLLAGRAILQRGKSRAAKSWVWLLLGVIIVSFILAMGWNTPIFPWLYRHVPTFDMFKAPARWSLWAVFALAFLAGMGVENWRRPEGRGLYWTRLATAGAGAVTLGGALAWFALADSIEAYQLATMVSATCLAGMWGLGTGVLALTAPPNGHSCKSEAQGLKPIYEPSTMSLRGRTLPEAISRRVGRLLRRQKAPPRNDRTPKLLGRIWYAGVTVWVMLDLIVAGWGLNPGIELDFFRGQAATAARVEQLAADGRLYLSRQDEESLKFERYFTFQGFEPAGGWDDLRATLLPDLFLMDGIASVNQFDPLVPARYARWMDMLESTDSATREAMLRLMSVGVIEQMDSDSPEGVRFSAFDGMPRLRWFSAAQSAAGGEKAWAQVISALAGTPGASNLERVVILEDAAIPQATTPGEAALTLVEETNHRLVIQVEADAPGWLFVADVWYPGWLAWVDGAPAPVLKADYLFRAVAVPAGMHTVTLAYRPTWFYVGMAASLLGLGAVISLSVKRRSLPARG